MQPHLQPVPFHRRQRGEPATLREDGTQHAVALPLLAEQPNQQGMDRPVPERRAFLWADLGALPLQCHRMDGQPGRSEGHPQRHGQPDCRNGVQTAPRHSGCRHALLGGDAGQRRRLPGGGIILYLHRAGRLLLDGGNELPQLAFPFRAEDVRPHQRQTAARGHLRPADETGHHHQPQQVRAGRFGQRQVILHEPLGTAILRTRNAHRIGGHRKLV